MTTSDFEVRLTRLETKMDQLLDTTTSIETRQRISNGQIPLLVYKVDTHLTGHRKVEWLVISMVLTALITALVSVYPLFIH